MPKTKKLQDSSDSDSGPEDVSGSFCSKCMEVHEDIIWNV